MTRLDERFTLDPYESIRENLQSGEKVILLITVLVIVRVTANLRQVSVWRADGRSGQSCVTTPQS